LVAGATGFATPRTVSAGACMRAHSSSLIPCCWRSARVVDAAALRTVVPVLAARLAAAAVTATTDQR